MTINAVQTFVKGLYDGMESSYFPKPLQAHIAPPIVGTIANPQLYIWGEHFREHRIAFPRNGGWKETDHTLSLWLYVAQRPNANGVDQGFPVLLEDVLQKSRAVTLPVPLRDPTTDFVSQLTAIGEEISVRYETPRALDSQRTMRLGAFIQMSCVEHFQH